MELFIDNMRAEMDQMSSVAVSISVASTLKPEYGRTGYSKSVEIPMTVTNRRLMGNCEQIYAAKRFNAERHEARLEHDGCVLLEGYIQLTACEKYVRGGRYVFNIIGIGKRWANHAADNGLSTLFPDYNVRISAQTIMDSWTDPVPVRWLPVLRNRYEPYNSSVSLTAPEKILSSGDYHPFIHLRSVVKAIFSEAGYEVVSSFIDSTYFDQLYMSGRYSERDVASFKKRMDFMASRFDQAASVANSAGLVYADPNAVYSSVGNIVDTADPTESRNGKLIDGVFNNGGCFCKIGNRVAFVPDSSISVGFEYKLKYVTGYKMSNVSQLIGFDKIYLGVGNVHQFKLTNRFPDRRNEFRPLKSYKCKLFDYVSGYTYRLLADYTSDPNAGPDNQPAGGYNTVVLAEFSKEFADVSSAKQGYYGRLRVVYLQPGSQVYYGYGGGWALYDGFVSETGETEVELTIRSTAQNVSPASPKYFDSISFGGAQSGMTFKLIEAQVRPVFQPQPTDGDTVRFSDIAVHNITRLAVVKALWEMFGLCCYVDDFSSKVYIEPMKRFYSDSVVLDWSGKLDLSRPVVIGELAAEVPPAFCWSYRSGDGATSEYNIANGGRLGEWRVQTCGQWKGGETKTYVNPVFTTSVNSTGGFPSSKSASVPNAGDRSKLEDVYVDDLNFPTKIVRYAGLKELPEGEWWGWPYFGTEYPLSAFHYPHDATVVLEPESPCGTPGNTEDEDMQSGYTLCYEDRDGVVGLHKWWDGLLEAYKSGIRLTAWLRLSPQDIEPFVRTNKQMRDFRAKFMLHIDGEWSEWRLEEICDYNPYAPSTKCVFNKIV